MFKALCLFILFYLLQNNNSIASSSKGYPITTLLNAKWTRTPIHLEVAEFLHDGNPSHYWEFVDSLAKLSPTIEQLNSDEKQYNLALDLVSKFIGSNQIGLLKLSLSLRSITPLVQAHLQIAGDIKPDHCMKDVFVQIGYQVICDISELGSTIHNQKGNGHSIELFEFDHIYPGSHNNSVTVILYGQIGTPLFNQFHAKLKDQAEKGVIQYVIRNYMQQLSTKRVRLSGYGVELHLKSTEYKSQDDSPTHAEEQIFSEDDQAEVEVEGLNFALLRQRYPHLALSLDRLRSDLSENHETIEPLKEHEFQDLGLQAAERIASIDGDEALFMLQHTAQNFPIQAKSLLHIPVTDEFRNEMKNNINLFARNLNLQPPDAALFLNGMFFDADTLDINILLETLRSESKVLDGLHKIGIKGMSSAPLLALDLSSSSSKEFAIDIRDTAISWINDIENDAQYKRWSSSVLDLLRPTFPGMMRNVRKNLFNLVLIFDPIASESRALVKLAESFVLHSAPIRLGIVFNTVKSNKATEDAYRAVVCGFNYVSQQKSNSEALGFLTDIFADISSKAEITAKDVQKQMKKKFNKLTSDQIDDILGEDSDFDYGRKLSNEFVERLGTKEMPQVLLNGAPLVPSSLNADDFEEAVLTEIMQQTPTIQKAVYRGELDDNMEVINYLMSQPHVMPRLNDRILSKDNIKYLDLSGSPHTNIEDVTALAQLSNIDMTATLLANLKHFGEQSNKQKFMGNQLHFLTIWVVGDLNTKSGKSLFTNTLKFMKENKGVRVGFIPNADNQQPFKKDNINNLVWAILNTLGDDDSIKLISKLLDLDDLSTFVIPESVQGFLRETELHLKLLRVYCQRVLGFGSSKNGVIVNGKIIGPLNDAETFEVEDYNLLEKFTNHLYIDKIKAALKESSSEQEQAEITSDSLLRLVSLLVPRQTTKTRYTLPEGLQQDRTVVSLEAKQQNEPRFNIVAVVDPASRGAQKLAPILILLRNVVNCNIKLFLCAVEKHSDMPIKNFYRFVMEPELQFLTDGKATDGPIAKFVGLPSNSLLTQSLSAPENWLVEVVRSVHDLDNIKLANINGPVHSEYELEYLLLEGHCFDTQSGAPPRGLQVTLGTKTNPILVDTIVMANLGYFQLKANPGAWTLQLRHGKSADIYDITSAEGPNTRHASNGTRVIISSLKSHVLKLRVTKKPGMQRADLLGDEVEPSSGIWSSITNTITGGDSSVPETINIFSVASGHLYERLLRIMMVSLLKHTKSPVKFWFLKNYLSPQFIDVLPHMAKQYKFDYELVQYKWPRWLHQQTEKQRIIWGYKILFLDVLFPLDVKKIIFVDADQIVRADMKELHDLDLGGAPYGYTPFCDSRKEMEGFRFWKIGYWKNHLQGRKYHISALYVVDLKRFRKIAAGDRLRGQYQALSQDPNSLANLDQDLPNNMIHQVPIASLPQDWLWCETWCSSETIKTAKTIDLCNNPQTKEAKLDAAQRIVPEWKDYDNEIKQLMTSIEAEPEVKHSAEGNKGNKPEHIEL